MSRRPPEGGTPTRSCATELASSARPVLESRLQAARERKIPPEGGTPTRSCATELASSESSSLESRLQAARQTRFFMTPPRPWGDRSVWLRFQSTTSRSRIERLSESTDHVRAQRCVDPGALGRCSADPPARPGARLAFGTGGPLAPPPANVDPQHHLRHDCRGAARPDSERIQLYERIKCPASGYSGDTAKALHCQRDNSKTGGVPISQPTGLKYRCRNRMDRLLGTCTFEGGCFL